MRNLLNVKNFYGILVNCCLTCDRVLSWRTKECPTSVKEKYVDLKNWKPHVLDILIAKDK